MNNLSNKVNKALSFVCYFSVVVFSVGCSDDEVTPECGCDSETISNVPNEDLGVPIKEQTTGLLYYKGPEMMDRYLNDPQYSNSFWIFQGTPGCYNCQRHLVICNENLLPDELNNLKNTTDSIPVVFNGELKRLCTEPFIAPGDYFYTEIKLNTIESTIGTD